MKTQTALLILLAALCIGCASFRGIPSHGGGKRFDEEQRLIAAATRTAIDQLDVSQLQKRKVRIVSEFLTTYGSGNVTFGGLQEIGFTPSYQTQTADYLGPAIARTGEQRDIETSSASIRYRPDMNFYTSPANTDRDAAYVIACLEMKLRHAGAIPCTENEEITLYILLDVLGTNLSRKDQLIRHTDYLDASCELTCYAVTTKTGAILFESRRCGGTARYEETATLFTGHSRVRRSVSAAELLPAPDFHTGLTAGEEPPVEPADPPPAETGNKERPSWHYYPTYFWNLIFPVGRQPAAGQPSAPPARPAEGADKEQQMEALEAQAVQMIRTGKDNQAIEVIRQMRAIDPAAEEIKQIKVLQNDGL